MLRRHHRLRGGLVALALGAILLPQLGVRAQAPVPRQGPPSPRFPAQLRPPDDPAVVERGRRLYSVSCRSLQRLVPFVPRRGPSRRRHGWSQSAAFGARTQRREG
jgi:hypothetical protein